MSKNATGTQVDQNREDEDGRISQDTATPTARTNQADNFDDELQEIVLDILRETVDWNDNIVEMAQDHIATLLAWHERKKHYDKML